MQAPITPGALQDAALRFLQRFGLVAAAWATLLGLSVPDGVRDATILGAGLSIVWVWALASQLMRPTRVWWSGWFMVAVGLELLGPLAGSNGDSLAGGVSFLVLAAVAMGGRRWQVAAVVAVFSATALARPAIDDAWSVAGSVSTVLLFCFGGLALTLLVEAITTAAAERDRLQAALADAERDAAVAHERGEAAARLHDSVLQTLTAIGRTTDPVDSARLASRASQELRDFLRRSRGDQAAGDLGDRLRAAVTTAADGADVGVAVVGEHAVDAAGVALVDAVAEAVRNAVVHGAPPVRVLLERVEDAGHAELVAWVSDRGDGFAPELVPADRLGVRGSIVERVEALGGTATLDASDGCEWRLAVPTR